MTGVTDKDGVIILPPASEGVTDKDGKTDISETIPRKDTDGDGKEDTEESKTEYNITVEDTKGKIENAYIEIKDGKITVTLPDTHTLTTSNQTTVTVLDKENKAVAKVCRLQLRIKKQGKNSKIYRHKRQGYTSRQVNRWRLIFRGGRRRQQRW